MTTPVPVIDVSGWDSGPVAQRAIATQIDAACTTVGYFQLGGHGVPQGLIDALLQAAEAFFHSPAELKQRYVPPSKNINRGWAPLGSESLAYSLGVDAPPDLFEAFNIGHEFDPNDPFHVAGRDGFFAPNIWPEEIPDFRDAFLTYFDALDRLAHRLTTMMAVALSMPSDFFEQHTQHSVDVMRVNWYERSADTPDPLPSQQRMGAHSDYGVLTILYADRVPGLEFVAPDGAWTPVIPEPGCFLVNLGDLLAQWTNDRWKSTLHRVVPPPSTAHGSALRRSVAFFHEADSAALVEVLPTCVSAGNPARYAPVTAGEHLLGKLMGPRELRKSEASSTVGERADALRS